MKILCRLAVVLSLAVSLVAQERTERVPAPSQPSAPKPSVLQLQPVPNANTAAANVSAGAFGSSAGGGNYSFPASLSVGTTTAAGALFVTGSAANGYALFVRGTKGMYINPNYNGADTFGYVGMRTGESMGLALSSDETHPEYLFVNNAGNIGIGTTTPATAYALNINAGDRSGILIQGTGGLALGLVNAARAWSIANGVAGSGYFSVYDSTSAQNRLVINPSGNVGIGTSSPDQPLVVQRAGASNYLKIIGDNNPALDIGSWWTDGTNHVYAGNLRGSTGLTGAFTVWTGGASRLNVLANGNVGIGTTTASAKLTVSGQALFNLAGTQAPVVIQHDLTNGQYSYGLRIDATANNTGPYGVDSSWLTLRTNTAIAPTEFYWVNPSTLYYSGNVGIGAPSPAAKLHVVGNLRVDGDITGNRVIGAVYQDIAEWVPASHDLQPGSVVIVSADKNNEVSLSFEAYDTKVAGVVSAMPGIVLGVESSTKELIATYGRVKVRVDATAEPIRAGDLLVTSSKPGIAMKSLPIHVGEIAMHRPGTIIGKALEPLEGGEGQILVLLSLQ